MRYFFLIIFVVVACSKNGITEAELNQYIVKSENGLLKVHEKGGSLLKMQYRPQALVAKNTASDSDTSLHVDDKIYFLLQMSVDGKDIESYSLVKGVPLDKTVNFLSFHMAEQISLYDGHKTISPLTAFYSRTTGMLPYTQIMIVFDKKELTPITKELVITLKEIGLGTGDTQFNFSLEDIQKVPNLKK